MSAAWNPATTWTLGNYSTNVDALLSEVLNVQSEMSEEPPFTIWTDTYKMNFTIAELLLGLFLFCCVFVVIVKFLFIFRKTKELFLSRMAEPISGYPDILVGINFWNFIRLIKGWVLLYPLSFLLFSSEHKSITLTIQFKGSMRLLRLLKPGCCSILFRRTSGSPMLRAISLTFTLILFSLIKACLLILGWGHRHSWAIDIDGMDLPGFLDFIELGRGDLPMILKGMAYL